MVRRDLLNRLNKRGAFKFLEILALLVFLTTVFVANYWFILNHFFIGGGIMLDSGWFAGLVYRNPTLQQPLAMGGDSYFSTHFSPILQLFSLLSYLVPIPLIFYYAFSQGLIYLLVAVGGVSSLWGLFSQKNRWALIPLGFLFAFNGVVQASITFPHFEPIYAGFALLFLVSLFRGKWRLAGVLFFLALLVREDTGFHLFGFLFPLLLATLLENDLVRYRSRLAIFSVVAIFYSVTAIFIQKTLFKGDSAITRIYLGDPPFSHLTIEFLTARFDLLTNNALYVLLPWFLLLVSALWLRSFSLGIGFIAVLPWICLNSLALSDAAGGLWSYYAYPTIVSLLWPSLWYLLKKSPEELAVRVQAVQVLILILSAGLFTTNDRSVMQQAFTRPIGQPSDYRRIEHSVDIALNQKDIYFDASLAAFFPQKISVDRMVHRGRDNSQVKAVMGFYNGIEMDLCQDIAHQNSLTVFQAHKGGRFYVLSQGQVDLGQDWLAGRRFRESSLNSNTHLLE